MDNNTFDDEGIVVEPGSYFIAIGMIIGYLLYALAIILGIPLNILVLYRMLKLSTQLTDFYSRGTGIPLCLVFMAVFDLVSLLAVCVHYILSFEIALTEFTHALCCKLGTYFDTSMSIWSWLIASSIRYCSVYYPLFHYRLTSLPSLVLGFCICVTAVVNLPILFMVDYSASSNECTQQALVDNVPELNRVFLCIEIIWSFCCPSGIIIFLDSSVYFRRKNPELETNLGRRQVHKKHRVGVRWLFVGLIDVLLNAPENIFRLIVILDVIDMNSVGEFYLFARMFAQVLYYSQFAFNVVYLALFIYDKSTRFNDSNKSKRTRESIQHSAHHEQLCRVIVECQTKMDLNDTIDISNISEPPPLLLPETVDFGQYLEKPKISRPQPNSTTVYYYLNDEELPFKIEVPVQPSKLTLAYLKCALNRQNFKCYVVQTDPELQREVKAEVTDDYALLKPNSHGHFEFYLLSNEPIAEPKAGGTLRTAARKKRFIPSNRQSTNFFPKPMPSGLPPMGRKQQTSSIYHNLEMHHQRNKRRPYRATMSDESTNVEDDSSPLISKKYLLRNYAASDSETSANFTSVSELENNRHRNRKRMGKMRRRTRSHSFLSDSCEDTDVSVRVDLLTVELNLSSGREFGLNVIVRKTANYHGIYVGTIEPNSVVALDGRIKPNQLIIEVNGFPLDNCTCDDAIATLQNEVHSAARRRSTITLTLSENPQQKRQTLLQLPDESIRPLDTECWRDTVNMCYNISLRPSGHPSNFMNLPQIPPNTNDKNWPSSGFGSICSSAVSGGRKHFHADSTPMEVIVKAMSDPCTGLNRRNHTQLNLTISESFSGQDLINWLADNVEGLEDRKKCEKYSGDLLRNGFIEQKFKKNSFTAYCYYTINEDKLHHLNQMQQINTMKRGVLTPLENFNKPALDDTQVFESKHKCGKLCKFKRFMCLHNQSKPHSNAAKNS